MSCHVMSFVMKLMKLKKLMQLILFMQFMQHMKLIQKASLQKTGKKRGEYGPKPYSPLFISYPDS